MTKTRDLADLGGGFIQAGTGAVQRTTESKLQDVVSVKDFGAVGDGVADDTAAIQAALTAAAGKFLVFPPSTSTYLISSSLTVDSNTEVDLGNNRIKQKAGSRTANGLFYVQAGTSNVRIRNGIIDVNVAEQSYTAAKSDAGRGIFVYSASNVYISDIRFVNPYGSMVLAGASTYVYVVNCDIDDQNGTGTNAIVFNSCSYCSARDNTGTGKLGVTGYGIYIYGPSFYNSAINNKFSYWQIVAIGADYITSAGQPEINFCSIDGNILNAPSADTSVHFGLHCSVCNNTIIDSRDVGISVDYSSYTKVCNNVIKTTNASGIAIVGCVGCNISENVIRNPGSEFVSPVTAGARAGIWGPSSATGSAPYVYPAENVINDNIILNDLGATKMQYGITVASTGGNTNIIKGNRVQGEGASAYDVPSITNITQYETLKSPTLQNSWVNYGSPYSSCSYYKSEDGTVYLNGLVKDGTLGASIFDLPVGYRPTSQEMIPVLTSTGIGRLDIFTSGGIVLVSGGTGYVTLSGISFPTR